MYISTENYMIPRPNLVWGALLKMTLCNKRKLAYFVTFSFSGSDDVNKTWQVKQMYTQMTDLESLTRTI